MADNPTTPTEQTPLEGPPPPPPPTPLDPPRVYYSIVDRVPPLVVFTQEDADKLDPKLWITLPPVADAEPKTEPKWPQLYYNVNSPPKVVNSEAEANALGNDWHAYDIEPIAKAQLKACQ